MKSVILKVEGMSCGHCVNAIEGGLNDIKVKGKVDLKNKTVQVDYNENEISLESIKKTIENQGYKVQ